MNARHFQNDIRATLRRSLLRVADIFSEAWHDADPDPARTGERASNVCYALAWLYATPFDGNRHFRKDATLAAALAAAESRLARQTQAGGYTADNEVQQGDEWQAYFLIRTAEVLGRDGLGPERWTRWADSVARYVACHGARGFFYSAPNHDAWKCTTIRLAGEVYGRQEWKDLADFQITQLLRYQAKPGFWDENRHHGPSMSYNHTMSTPLYLYGRLSERADVSAALERLLDFMIRYGIPDGSPGGALDGRMHARSGRLNVAMTGSPAGRRWNRLAWENWEKSAVADNRPLGGDAGMLAAWHADFLRFAEDGPEADAVPPERDGHIALDHVGDFRALARRQGPWHLVLSGVFSDIPKESDNEFRTTRQNRIELWHEKTGPMLGGGSLHRSVRLQLANLFLDTGYFTETEFGQVSGQWPETERAVYFPRWLDVGVEGNGSRLDYAFAHAQARFSLCPFSDTVFEIVFSMRSVGVRRAFVCLPLIRWPGADILVDNRLPDAGPSDAITVEHSVDLTGSRRGAGWRVVLPEGTTARLNAPFTPVFVHRPETRKKNEDRPYDVALLAIEAQRNGPPLPGPIRLELIERQP